VAEVMRLEMWRQEAAEREIEAVTLLVPIADETQRLERLHELRAQWSEGVRCGDRSQRSRQTHVALTPGSNL